ncbi:hypothetical protein CCAN11_1810010 [Capnocytophaga canimorsus]|uniref:Uncharacterized protein n=1 Tax=Capnocytophaga canimorsus TaxID=28188 RepID=A0A0B7IFQ2_9FLAO|nr:hypothetical protein CCAN11_1810010 [Capnocytophaga canimorsus]
MLLLVENNKNYHIQMKSIRWNEYAVFAYRIFLVYLFYFLPEYCF